MLSQLWTFRRAVLARAIRHAGSINRLAKACGVTASAITNAKARGTISPELALAIDWATNGRVSASQLREDIWSSPASVPMPGRWRKMNRKAKRVKKLNGRYRRIRQ